jgi:hypothetical protein
MKLVPFLLLISVSAFSQQKENKKALDELDSLWSKYKYRTYEPDKCNCPLKPGQRVHDSHPNAKWLNDSTLWEWREVDVWGNGQLEKIYDLKPQYKDTIIRNDGTPFEVPVWLKNPNWKKPEEKPDLTKKSTIL